MRTIALVRDVRMTKTNWTREGSAGLRELTDGHVRLVVEMEKCR